MDGIGFEPDEIDQRAATRDARLKWVIVADIEQPEGRRANAVACIAAAFGGRVGGLLGADGTVLATTTRPLRFSITTCPIWQSLEAWPSPFL